jgi:hypothetical protein
VPAGFTLDYYTPRMFQAAKSDEAIDQETMPKALESMAKQLQHLKEARATPDSALF